MDAMDVNDCDNNIMALSLPVDSLKWYFVHLSEHNHLGQSHAFLFTYRVTRRMSMVYGS